MTTADNMMWFDMLARNPDNMKALGDLLAAVYLLYGRDAFEFEWLVNYDLYQAIPFSVRDLVDTDYLYSKGTFSAGLYLTDKGIALAQEGV